MFDLRQGSLYEPVAGELFDLVVTNPPFVIVRWTNDTPQSPRTAPATHLAWSLSASPGWNLRCGLCL